MLATNQTDNSSMVYKRCVAPYPIRRVIKNELKAPVEVILLILAVGQHLGGNSRADSVRSDGRRRPDQIGLLFLVGPVIEAHLDLRRVFLEPRRQGPLRPTVPPSQCSPHPRHARGLRSGSGLSRPGAASPRIRTARPHRAPACGILVPRRNVGRARGLTDEAQG